MVNRKPSCLRCGYCCRGTFALVPKNYDSDLSAKHLYYLEEKYGWKYVSNYIATNSESLFEPYLMVKTESLPTISMPCKWLIQDHFELSETYANISPACCSVYERRSATCSTHREGVCCSIGIELWKLHVRSGNKLPEDVRKLVRLHPGYVKDFLDW